MRGFFQNFQDGICAFALKVINRIDNGDAPAALARRRAEKRHRTPHVVDPDDGIKFARLLVDASLEYQQVALRLRGNAPRNRMRGIDRERCCLLHLGCQRIGMRQHEAGQSEGKRRLADTGWPADQPRMGNPAAFVGIKQSALGVAMAKQRRRLARQLALPLIAVVAGHGADVSATSAFSGFSRSCTIAQIRSATTSARCATVDDDAPRGLFGRERAIGLCEVFRGIPSTPLRSGRLLFYRAGDRRVPAPLARARQE